MDKLADPKKPSSQLPPRALFMTLEQATWLVDNCELIKYDMKTKDFDGYFDACMMGPKSKRRAICLTCWQSLAKSQSAHKKHKDAECLFVDRNSFTLTSQVEWFRALAQAKLLKPEDIKVKHDGKTILETIFYMPKFFQAGDPEPIDMRRMLQTPKSTQLIMRGLFEKYQSSEEYSVAMKAQGLNEMQGHSLDDHQLRQIVLKYAHKKSKIKSTRVADETMEKLRNDLSQETMKKVMKSTRKKNKLVWKDEEKQLFDDFVEELRANDDRFLEKLREAKFKLENEIGPIDKKELAVVLKGIEEQYGIKIPESSKSIFDPIEENPMKE